MQTFVDGNCAQINIRHGQRFANARLRQRTGRMPMRNGRRGAAYGPGDTLRNPRAANANSARLLPCLDKPRSRPAWRTSSTHATAGVCLRLRKCQARDHIAAFRCGMARMILVCVCIWQAHRQINPERVGGLRPYPWQNTFLHPTPPSTVKGGRLDRHRSNFGGLEEAGVSHVTDV